MAPTCRQCYDVFVVLLAFQFAMLSTSIHSTTADRIEIPFGRGWRWYRGDAPDGPGLGSGTLSQFVPRTSCTNMQPRIEWQPAGDKNAGQNYTVCAVACSYAENCVAYDDGNGRSCHHGLVGNTTCSGTCTKDCVMQRKPNAEFQRNFSFAQSAFDDTTWPKTTLPHDPLINQTFVEEAGEGAAFLLRRVVWYRKHFNLPEEVRGKHIFLYFEGAFEFSEHYLNGHPIQDHAVGYTTFTVRLDNVSSLVYGPGTENVLAVRVDPTFGSGHWYEGGGINRPVKLVVAPPLHFVHNGIFANPNSDGTTLQVSIEVENLEVVEDVEDVGDQIEVFSKNNGKGKVVTSVPVNLTLRDAMGDHVASMSCVASITSVTHVMITPTTKLQTWSPQTPITYTLTANVGDDQVNITVAVRTFVVGKKATLNGHQIELQGFSHHPSFAGMGAMTNPRLALFLVQTTKALGVNFWRNSHNPYEDAVYDMLTTLGIMCWDENRNFGSWHANEYHDMIKSHRSHGAIMIWGMCNEAMCGVENGFAAETFMKVKNNLDPDRPQTGNFVHGEDYNFPHVDIITQSGSSDLALWHNETPSKPITSGEHGFGNNVLYYSRSDEDRALPRLGNVSEVFSGALDSGGTGWSNLKPKQTIPFLLSGHGLGMWAMMDYYGEAFMGWPTMIKSRGHLDVAGFPRSTAWWFRTNYLANTAANVSQYQRPLVGGNWDVQVRALTPCQIFSSTNRVKIVLDDVVYKVAKVSNDYGLADLLERPPNHGPTPCNVTLVHQDSVTNCSISDKTFGCYDRTYEMWVDKGCRGSFESDGLPVHCACLGTQGYCSSRYNCSAANVCPKTITQAHNVTVIAIDDDDKEVGSHSLVQTSPATKMEMIVDVPSKATGTGDKLYLDGQDVGFLRVQLVDDDGVLSRYSDVNVTFSVVSGPIRIVGVGSGDIANHQAVQGHTYSTWQGLGRVVVQVTLDCTGVHRDLANQIDVDADATAYATSCPTEDAVLMATSDNFTTTVRIPISGAVEDSPMEVARATKSLDTYTYFDDVQP